jgi:hypothetical protein
MFLSRCPCVSTCPRHQAAIACPLYLHEAGGSPGSHHRAAILSLSRCINANKMAQQLLNAPSQSKSSSISPWALRCARFISDSVKCVEHCHVRGQSLCMFVNNQHNSPPCAHLQARSTFCRDQPHKHKGDVLRGSAMRDSRAETLDCRIPELTSSVIMSPTSVTRNASGRLSVRLRSS